MEEFRRGRLAALVATTIVEVGIDVPNASLLIVEHADRFGLSQLHQLRGRIGRGVHPGTCLLVAGAEIGETARARLQALQTYGELVNRYNLAFDRKWAQASLPPEPILGSSDIQALADLGVSYSRIEDMRAVPFDRRNIVQIAVTAALPVVPLLFLIMPVGDILRLISRALL